MAQRRDQVDRRAITARAERGWARLTGWTLGYGYQPWRALLLLLATVTFAVIIGVVGGSNGGLKHTTRSPSPNAPCTTVESVGVGLDTGLPLIKTTARDYCSPTSTKVGETITIAGWVLQLLAWAFATLIIAGFTGAVRKT